MLRAAALLLVAACAVPQPPDGAEASRRGGAPEEVVEVRLTARAPRAVLPVSAAVVAERPPLLEIRVPEVENQGRTPFALRLALGTGGQEDEAAEAIVGHVSVHPPERPARFLLRASDAWARLDPEEGEPVRLLVELLPVQETGLGELAVTVGPVVWREEAAGDGRPGRPGGPVD
jgi:hypothetical protein